MVIIRLTIIDVSSFVVFFFFQAEDGIRDLTVTGVQTCALPICGGPTNSTHLFATLAYQTGLASSKLGEGAAIALFLFPVLVVTVIVQLHFIRKDRKSVV